MTGPNKSKVIALTRGGSILAAGLKFINNEFKLISTFDLKLRKSMLEWTSDLVVCPKKEIFAVVSNIGFRAARIFIFELDYSKGVEVKLKKIKDVLESGLRSFSCLKFLDYFSNHLLLVTLTQPEKEKIQMVVYDYNKIGKSLIEMDKFDRKWKFVQPLKICAEGWRVSSTDAFGRKMTCSFYI